MGALYRVGSGVITTGLRGLGVRVVPQGLDNIPSTGPAIVASNHIGYLDFAFVMLTPPTPRREMRFLARADLFANPAVGWFLRSAGQIPTDAHGDPLAAMRAAIAVLRDGGIVALHPEGTISPSFVPRKAASGAVRLAEETGAPIVPCAIWGSQRILTKWRPKGRVPRGIPVSVRYAAPYHPSGGSAMERTRDLMDRIRALVEEAWASEPLEPGAWWVPAHLGGSAPSVEEAEELLAAQRAERRARAAERRAGTDPSAGPSSGT